MSSKPDTWRSPEPSPTFNLFKNPFSSINAYITLLFCWATTSWRDTTESSINQARFSTGFTEPSYPIPSCSPVFQISFSETFLQIYLNNRVTRTTWKMLSHGKKCLLPPGWKIGCKLDFNGWHYNVWCFRDVWAKCHHRLSRDETVPKCYNSCSNMLMSSLKSSLHPKRAPTCYKSHVTYFSCNESKWIIVGHSILVKQCQNNFSYQNVLTCSKITIALHFFANFIDDVVNFGYRGNENDNLHNVYDKFVKCLRQIYKISRMRVAN